MQSTDTFTVNINGKKIICNKQMAKMSTFLSNLLFLGTNTFDFGLQDISQNNEEQQIFIELVDQQTFMHFVHFCQINNFKQPTVIKPEKEKENLQSYMDEKNYNFIQKFDTSSPEIVALGKAAIFLGCQSLLRVVSAKYATLLYFGDSKQAYEEKCAELGIPSVMNVESLARYRQNYPTMYNC